MLNWFLLSTICRSWGWYPRITAWFSRYFLKMTKLIIFFLLLFRLVLNAGVDICRREQWSCYSGSSKLRWSWEIGYSRRRFILACFVETFFATLFEFGCPGVVLYLLSHCGCFIRNVLTSGWERVMLSWDRLLIIILRIVFSLQTWKTRWKSQHRYLMSSKVRRYFMFTFFLSFFLNGWLYLRFAFFLYLFLLVIGCFSFRRSWSRSAPCSA